MSGDDPSLGRLTCLAIFPDENSRSRVVTVDVRLIAMASSLSSPSEPDVTHGGSERVRGASGQEALLTAAMAEANAVPTGRSEMTTSLIELCVVFPMFNEAERIEKSMRTLLGSTLNRDDVELVFVDDGSSDSTTDTVTKLIANLPFVRPPRLLSLGRNQGKGAAVRTGMLASSGKYTAFLDADLSLNPSVLDEFLERLRTDKADVIVGHRIVNPERQPRLRRLMSLTFSALTSRLAPTGVRDTQCACKVFTTDAVQKIFPPMVTDGFAFDVELLLRAKKSGLKVIEQPVHWRHSDGSRVNQVVAPFIMLSDVVKVRRLIK